MSKITESARGEDCQIRYTGVCSHDPAKTIWSHCRHGAAGRGKGFKAVDVAGAYGCTDCDAVYDGQRKPPSGVTREQLDADWAMGHFRSLVILKDKGLVK
ncbi:MAG: DUF1364 family protein [Anaerolineales bacterium]|nr:DUF1364 family protein [Anaerolineales bacterium]